MEISVIVPLYKAEKYIRQCLYSLLDQTIINDIEIIVVDDHGNDNSVDIVAEIQNIHPFGNHIFLYETPCNSGAWAARNLGLSKAAGKWVAFVDADDWCELSMYESLYNAAIGYNADLAFCSAQKEFMNGRSKKMFQPIIDNGEITDKTKKILYTSGIAYFWTGLYRKQFLVDNDINFPQGKFSEDSFFWWHCISCCHSVAYIDVLGYHYRIQQDSVSKLPDSEKYCKKQSMYDNFISLMRNKGLYDNFKSELDYLYIKKGLLIPLIIYTINARKFDSCIIHSMINNALNINIDTNNIYLRSDFKSRCLLSCFRNHPKLMRLLLHMIMKTDPF